MKYMAKYFSLNRTMQYGNSHESTEKEKIQIGLNRTMQYGNYNIIIPYWKIDACLNRTMQYGNSRGKKKKK